MKALLIVDIQNDFLPGGALAVPEGNEIISVVNAIQPHFPLVVATQDWHPAGHKSFASSHPGKKVLDTVMLGDVEQILWPDHCVQGSKGAELASELSLDAVEAIFRKGMQSDIDSYSVFFDNHRLKNTNLADYLRAKGVTQVYIAGLAGDFCVAYSALDALDVGFETFVIEDATKAISAEGFIKMKESIEAKGGKIITSESLGTAD